MFVVTNCLGGPGELGEWLEQQFALVASTARGVAGLREFHLRKLEQEGPECLYVSLTIWDDQPSFNDWRTSNTFEVAHAEASKEREKFRSLHRRKRYDFDVSSIPDLAYLDELVLTRLSKAYHSLITPPAHFSEVLTIVEKEIFEEDGMVKL
jgi:heme-degrading monooxygenase HmoA